MHLDDILTDHYKKFKQKFLNFKLLTLQQGIITLDHVFDTMAVGGLTCRLEIRDGVLIPLLIHIWHDYTIAIGPLVKELNNRGQTDIWSVEEQDEVWGNVDKVCGLLTPVWRNTLSQRYWLQ